MVTNRRPTVTIIGSTGTEIDTGHQSMTWLAQDLDGPITTSATLTQNGFTVVTGSLSADTIDFNHLGAGSYVLTVSATDSSGITTTATRSVTVTDDDPNGPQIFTAGSAGTENDGQSQIFSWFIDETFSGNSGLASLLIEIKQDGTTIYSTNSLADFSGFFNFDSYGLGTFTMTISATDADNEWSGDRAMSSTTRTVVVVDDDPNGPSIVLGGPSGMAGDNAIGVVHLERHRRLAARQRVGRHQAGRHCDPHRDRGQRVVQSRHFRPGNIHDGCLGNGRR